MKPDKIFIHHDGALGDMLLSLQCISIIRKSAPHIHIAGRRDLVHFLREAGLADEVSSADSLLYSSLYTESLDETLRSFLSFFSTAFVFTRHTDSPLVINMRTVIPDTRPILTIPPEPRTEHASAFRIKQCKTGADAEQRKITLCIGDEEKLWAAEFLKGKGYAAEHILITLHPGSGGKKKCWPIENYAALIRRFMKDSRIFCIVLAGPAEDAPFLSRHIACSGRVIILHNESLMRVAALLSLSAFYLGNDSGISHLAGILGCRGVVLFGPTDPVVWRPQGNTLQVVRFLGSATEAAPEIFARFNSIISLQGKQDIPYRY